MHVIFFDEALETFVNELERPIATKVYRTIDLLKRFGSLLTMPYSKKIDHNVFELRIRGQQEVRLLYTFYKGSALLVHGFIKKTNRIPLKELLTTRQKIKRLDGT